jgi:CxxC motif-containing protein
MEKRDLICICCPMGCMMEVTIDAGEVVQVTGNTCPRGKVYAMKEVSNPTRIVTSTVRVFGGTQKMVSVKTKEDVPKGQMFACLSAMKEVEVVAPVAIGQIIIENIAGTGVDLVATKSVAKA